MTPHEKLEQYSKEITEDLKLNEMVIQQKSFEIPQRKHYWVTKLILEIQELNKLERKKKVLEKIALEKQEPLVQMSTASMKNVIANTKPMQEITQEIEDQKMLVEYLNKVEKIFAYITNDVKNIIEIMQLQVLLFNSKKYLENFKNF